MKRKIAAILAADVAEYSRLVAEDEEETLTRLSVCREVFEDFVGKAHGRVFNTAGDAVLAEFPSAVEATRCAIDIQESLRTRNMGYPPHRQMLFRIGITIGDVVEREGDLLGDGVNIAARLEALATPGGICVSRSVYEQVANKIAVHFKDIGIREVKNIPQPVHAFIVEIDSSGPGVWRQAPGARAKPQRSRLPMIAGGVGLGLGLAALAIVLRNPGGEAPPPTPTPVQRVESLTQTYAELAKSGGLVQSPRTAPQLYHNARSYEARGDSAAARQAYLALAELGVDAIDAHLRFAALLRAQDGRAGAREVYDRLREKSGLGAVSLVHATLFEGDERRRRIEAFAAARPDYGPAHLLLADEYSDDRIGPQTIADRRKEAAALKNFLAADADGRLVPYFLDQSVLAEWLERARRRLSALDLNLKTAAAAPTVKFMRSNAGWNVSISTPEPATAIAWRIGGAGEFTPTGQISAIDQRTGRPAPNPSFELPGDTQASTIELRYEDAAGRVIGPFPIAFDPAAALADANRELLERFWTSWLTFGDDGRLLYYSHLMSYRCAIAKAEIGFDGAPPSQQLPMPPCDTSNPFSIPSGVRPYLAAPSGAKSVSARLTYVNGATSETREFRRK